MMRINVEFTQSPPLFEVRTLPGRTVAIRLYDAIEQVETLEDEPQRWRGVCYAIEVPDMPGLRERVGANVQAWLDKARAMAEENEAQKARAKRDKLLRDCDYTAGMDYPAANAECDAWRAYRQALRDVPEQAGFPWEIAWPVMPKREKSGE